MPRLAIVFDTETRTDRTQRMTFGGYRYLRDGNTVQEGLFSDEGLSDEECETLEEYVRDHRADVIGAVSDELRLLNRREFLNDVFYKAAFEAGADVVTFNEPFDLSRLACGVGAGRKAYVGGFSFPLFEYQAEDGTWRENRFRPRVGIKSVDSKRAFTGFTGTREGETRRAK